MSLPRADEPLMEADGQLGRNWYAFFSRIWNDGRTTSFVLPQSTVANLGHARDGTLKWVTNASGGACVAFCSGNAWFRVADNTPVT
jgi:hypothetical protein